MKILTDDNKSKDSPNVKRLYKNKSLELQSTRFGEFT